MNINLLKKLFLGAVIFFCGISSIAQTLQYKLNEDKSKVSLIIDHIQRKLTKAEIDNSKKGHPLLESRLYELNMIMDTIGYHSVLPTGENIWRFTIDVPDAKGFIVGLDDFYLPKGSQLFVYKKDDLSNAIVYMNEDNPKGGPYSFENLPGDNVVLEYVASSNTTDRPRIHLKEIGYKYSDPMGNPLSGFDHEKNHCMININCPQGQYWQNQKKGIVQLRIRKSSSTYLCSGSLINNTNQDATPYVLTAEHCFEYMNQAQIEQNTDYIFEYESPGCQIERPTYRFHRGAELLVLSPLNGGSDGALLKLSEDIPGDWDVYYNGWNRENDGNRMTSGSIIHHPQGDVKKITFYNKPLASGRWDDDASNPDATHWIISYSEGVTEGGSSGSPIFDQDGLIVGTLSGGDSKCTALNATDYYGKFWYHWNQGVNTSWHMSKYLDPSNKGVTKLDGLSASDSIAPRPAEQPNIKATITDDNLTIVSKDIFTKLRICNLSGHVVYYKEKDFQSSTVDDINIGGWARGVYIITASSPKYSNKSLKIFKK